MNTSTQASWYGVFFSTRAMTVLFSFTRKLTVLGLTLQVVHIMLVAGGDRRALGSSWDPLPQINSDRENCWTHTLPG